LSYFTINLRCVFSKIQAKYGDDLSKGKTMKMRTRIMAFCLTGLNGSIPCSLRRLILILLRHNTAVLPKAHQIRFR
jgi:hypothetical protein